MTYGLCFQLVCNWTCHTLNLVVVFIIVVVYLLVSGALEYYHNQNICY